VRVVERVARACITIGGVGTILSVALIFVFLLGVVLPLFRGARVGEAAPVEAAGASERPGAVGIDEYGRLHWEYDPSGEFRVFRADTGALLRTSRPFGDDPPTAFVFDPEKGTAAFGFGDGTVRFGRVRAAVGYPKPEELPEALRSLPRGAIAEHAGGLVEVSDEGVRKQLAIDLELEEPLRTARAGAPLLLDRADVGEVRLLAAYAGDGSLRICQVRERTTMTGETKRTLKEFAIPTEEIAAGPRPDWLFLSGAGDNVYLIWRSGQLLRFDVRNLSRPALAEKRLVVEEGFRLTAAAWLLGRTTLLLGDSAGDVRGWFGTKPTEDPGTVDLVRLEGAKRLEGMGRPVVRIAPSPRSRLVAVAHEGGGILLHFVTNERRIGEVRLPEEAPLSGLAISPKEDGLLARTGTALRYWRLDPGHPEASLRALFGKLWYESYPAPADTWQSAGGTDDFEPKLGLVPLIVGTLKATLYAMLMGVPIALLAAVFTSEFLHPRSRALVKSIIEMMAGLPSVVLGFLAAQVIAPFAEKVVPATLALLVTVPVSILLGAYLWQLLPGDLPLRLAGRPRIAAIALTIPLGVLLAAALGPVAERAFFEGDLRHWLSDPSVGDASGGLLLILLPLTAVAVFLGQSRLVTPWIRARSAGWDRRKSALFDLARFGVSALLTFGAAWLLAKGLGGLGADARGAYLGTYNQRNSLVVGFVMGFAIIPIIYTIAEDAMSSVPDHLRQGSLGAGATRWQTAVRIVIPTAMSGLFSAVMVGLGRAVGETMIVVMATGNTPLKDWNLFSGMRTLSANIATEMPEAARNSTHYRTLFLAALVLFAFTFAVNTLAETVRQRFRRRAFQL